jgi:homoserine acetyltransferase
MDCFDLSAHGGSFAAALAACSAEQALILGVESDSLFPIHEQAAIAEAFEHSSVRTRFVRMPSLEGHDAFLVDLPRFDHEIRTFLAP